MEQVDLKDDVGECANGCDYEGHCFTISRFDGFVLICPECFFDYVPEYHQEALLKVAERKLRVREVKQQYVDEHARRVKTYGGKN